METKTGLSGQDVEVDKCCCRLLITTSKLKLNYITAILANYLKTS